MTYGKMMTVDGVDETWISVMVDISHFELPYFNILTAGVLGALTPSTPMAGFLAKSTHLLNMFIVVQHP